MRRLPAEPATVRDIHLRDGFSESETQAIWRHLQALDRNLRPYQRNSVALELSVKDRDKLSQEVTLQCGLPGMRPLVASQRNRDLRLALNSVRSEMQRQLVDTRTEVALRSRK